VDDSPKTQPAPGRLTSGQRAEEPRDPSAKTRLDRWLAALVSFSGSDLLLVPGAPPCILSAGVVQRIDTEILDGQDIESAVIPALTPHALRVYRERRIADSSYRKADLGRFRINLHQERGSTAAAIRALPSKVPAFADLHLPPSVQSLARLARGLVLIGGPAGSGKSTTLAALVNEINRCESRHIVLIEPNRIRASTQSQHRGAGRNWNGCS